MAHSYKDLIAWQKAIAFVTEIYRLTTRFPNHEMYGLTSQLRRAAVSIPSNIAEGQGRNTKGEFRQFVGQARGSPLEIETQLLIANNLGYLSKAEAENLLAGCGEVFRIVNGLLRSLETPEQSREAGRN